MLNKSNQPTSMKGETVEGKFFNNVRIKADTDSSKADKCGNGRACKASLIFGHSLRTF